MKTLLAALTLSTAAIAAPSFHVSPSVSLLEARLDGTIAQAAPGLGVQGWMAWQKWCLGANLFGSALSLGTNQPGYALSIAPYICLKEYGVCVGPGFDFAKVQGGVSGMLEGFTWRKNTFFVLHFLPNFFSNLHIGG